MLIRAGFEIVYECPQPTPMLLMLDAHPDLAPLVRGLHGPAFDRDVGTVRYRDGFGNACMRIVAPEGLTTMTDDLTVEVPALPDPAVSAEQHPVQALPEDVLVYLLGSRYCDTDRLSDIAWGLFGGTAPGWARVTAICTYVQDRLAFSEDRTGPARTASEAHQQRHGVCRDYAHLATAMCRCMNIPARYCTGYLAGGAARSDEPMDFSAWFEAFLGGGWHVFDPRHAPSRTGRVLMARGRDATDVALCTTFGPCRLFGYQVRASVVPA